MLQSTQPAKVGYEWHWDGTSVTFKWLENGSRIDQAQMPGQNGAAVYPARCLPAMEAALGQLCYKIYGLWISHTHRGSRQAGQTDSTWEAGQELTDSLPWSAPSDQLRRLLKHRKDFSEPLWFWSLGHLICQTLILWDPKLLPLLPTPSLPSLGSDLHGRSLWPCAAQPYRSSENTPFQPTKW
jgi:hypothetical protein